MHSKDILTIHGKASLFRRVEMLLLVTPGYRKGVGSPQADGGHSKEHVLARAKGPGAGHSNGDTEGVTWKGFNNGICTAFSEVAIYKRCDPDEALTRLAGQADGGDLAYLNSPGANDDLDIKQLCRAFQMKPNTCYSKYD